MASPGPRSWEPPPSSSSIDRRTPSSRSSPGITDPVVEEADAAEVPNTEKRGDELDAREGDAAEDSDARENVEETDESCGGDNSNETRHDPDHDSGLDYDQDYDHDSGDIAATDSTTSAGQVCVMAPKTWYANWKSWLTYFEGYCERTMQVIPILHTMGNAERNRQLKMTKKGQHHSALLPEELDPYQRTYICTHGWPNRKPRGTGKRPRQHIRQTDCPFRFIVQWRYHKGAWQLQVKRGTFEHNHHVSSETYASYPCARGVSDVVVGARVEGMLAVGAKRSKIYDYLLEHDQNVIKADVDNMVQAYASSVSTVDDNEATSAQVGALAAADPLNCTSIAETESGDTGVISLATAFMRLMFSRFGEVLLLDCSHKTNRYNYQLLTFMTMNEFGEGAVAQHSLLEANGDWHMDRAIDHFKRAHPDGIRLSYRGAVSTKDGPVL
ncbi:hypothetical protein PF010_g27745 [Phytophthora fragariae]|uniref:ZSWIM1/3 RNaseH-like domain-containing protein n=1 Tax=Phytophthora fragariae TaxID=53985 RepID=A0A6G0JT28_9STRA|nr:hypothetical protein PF010_g27745 [Phytophthora fragariae]